MLGAISALEARHVSVTHGFPIDWSLAVTSTTPRWLLLAAVLPFVLRLGIRYPLTPPRRPIIAMHVALFLAVSVAHAMVDSWAVARANPEVIGAYLGTVH